MEEINKTKPKRPMGVTILAILAIIGGLLSIYNLISYMSFATFFDSSFPLYYLAIIGIIGIAISFLIAYGFWKGLRWSWFLAIILIIIGIIMQIANVSLLFFMLSMVVGQVILLPLLKEVREPSF